MLAPLWPVLQLAVRGRTVSLRLKTGVMSQSRARLTRGSLGSVDGLGWRKILASPLALCKSAEEDIIILQLATSSIPNLVLLKCSRSVISHCTLSYLRGRPCQAVCPPTHDHEATWSDATRSRGWRDCQGQISFHESTQVRRISEERKDTPTTDKTSWGSRQKMYVA